MVALAIGLALVEWLRGHVLTGFPWNALGDGFAANTLMMQPAALVGVYGLSFLAVLIFACPAVITDPLPQSDRGRFAFPVAVALLFAGLLGYGAVRLAGPGSEDVAGVRLRLVQPAIAQGDKWVPENRQWIFESYLSLSVGADGAASGDGNESGPDANGLDGITHLIWPESVFPFLLTEEPEALAAIAALLPEETTLITGALRAEGAGGARAFFNSIYVIAGDGTIRDAYDKVHLVPFGEYLPLRGLLESLGLENLTKTPGGFSPGYRRRPMTASPAPAFSPLICYEIAFPGNVVGRDGARPGWMLNVTNDAWFGESIGPYQHLHRARLRAVEEGLPVVRAANTGISAVIDARGRIRGSLALGNTGILDAPLPEADPPTVYARLGDMPLGAMLLLALGVLLGGRIFTARHDSAGRME
ncbi:apolipoprotein N-acyltransferase [Breoghania sp. L-A4]|uniref:apolipoprotein N-acyltransferase n=1 Tax=Breoghania sp. L-A4 TaxID=2304600 RepID=UPI003204EBE1